MKNYFLIYALEKRGMTVEEFAEKLGMSKYSTYTRINGTTDFKVGEAKKVAEILSLTKDEAYNIFFNNSVAELEKLISNKVTED